MKKGGWVPNCITRLHYNIQDWSDRSTYSYQRLDPITMQLSPNEILVVLRLVFEWGCTICKKNHIFCNCNYSDRYCDCDMCCSAIGGSNFCISFAARFTEQVCSLTFGMRFFWPRHLCSTTLLHLKWYVVTQFYFYQKMCSSCNSDTALCHIAISKIFWLILQL